MPFINAFHTLFCTHHLNCGHWIYGPGSRLTAKKKEARVKCWLDRQREIYGGVMDIDLPISGCDAVSSGHQIFDEFGMV